MLLTVGGADVALDVPRKLPLTDVPAVAALLTEFAARVEALSA